MEPLAAEGEWETTHHTTKHLESKPRLVGSCFFMVYMFHLLKSLFYFPLSFFFFFFLSKSITTGHILFVPGGLMQMQVVPFQERRFLAFSNRNAHLGPRDADMASLRRPRIAPRQRVGWARSAGFWGRITGRVVLNSAIAPRVRGRFKVRDKKKKRPIVHLIKMETNER